jgi:hypothetical protein
LLPPQQSLFFWGARMYRIFGVDKATFKTVDIAIASCFAELKMILFQELRLDRYFGIGFARIA